MALFRVRQAGRRILFRRKNIWNKRRLPRDPGAACAGKIYGTSGDFPETLEQLAQEVGAVTSKRTLPKCKTTNPSALPKRAGRTYQSIKAAARSVARALGGKLAGRWNYNKTFSVVRIDRPEGKTFRPIHRGGGWRWGDPPGPLPLYRADALPADGLVFVVEGEKCAEVVLDMGLAAVTSAHGSQSPGKSDWTPLAGRDEARAQGHLRNEPCRSHHAAKRCRL